MRLNGWVILKRSRLRKRPQFRTRREITGAERACLRRWEAVQPPSAQLSPAGQLHRNMRRGADDARRAIRIASAVGADKGFEQQYEFFGEHVTGPPIKSSDDGDAP
jgi:hypothetical protein